MKVDERHHRNTPFVVHRIAADFELLDVWRVDLVSEDERGFDAFLDCFWTAMDVASRSPLARLRVRLGARFGWDEGEARAIPGDVTTSVAARLTADDARRNRMRNDAPSPLRVAGVKTIYVFGDEALYEISNATVHALIHVGWSSDPSSAELAIYIKSRGLRSRLYMAAITPFRHLVVYPQLLRLIERLWRESTGRHVASVTR